MKKNNKIVEFFAKYYSYKVDNLPFSTYFAYEIKTMDANLYICIYLKMLNLAVYHIFFDPESCLFYGGTSEIFNSLDPEFLFSAVASDLNEKEPGKLKEIIQDFQNEINELNYQKDLKEFKHSLTSIMKSPTSEAYDNKFHLTLCLDETTQEENYRVSFYYQYNSFISRKMKPNQLINSIKNRNQVLGKGNKNLSLTYSFSLLDQQSKQVYDFLKNLAQNCYSTTKLEHMVSKNLQDLIILYKNDTILFNDSPYKVNLKELKPHITITEDFDLDVNEIEGYTNIESTDLYYSKETHSIDIVSLNRKYNKIYNLVKNSPVTSIKDFKDSFKYGVYLNFESYFDASLKVRRELRINALEINAYFDFNSKNEIAVHSSYFINEIEIKESALKDEALLVYNRYQEILQEYGFVDDLLTDQGRIWQFLNNDLTTLQTICNIYLSDKIKSKKLVKFYPPIIKIKNENSILNVFLENSEYSDEELYAILHALRNKRKFVLLKDNIINIDNDEAKEFAQLSKDLKLIENNSFVEKRELPPYFAFKVKDSSLVDTKDEYVETLYNDFKNFKNFNKELPPLNATLRPYQIDAFKWLNVVYKNQVGGVLADDMGLGKTLETISFIESLNINKPILIVAPTSLIFNRMNEFEKFSENEKIIPLYGNANERKKLIQSIDPDKKISYITSYDSLRNDIENYKDIHFDLVILDEAQFIKNTQAKKTQSVKTLNADHRLVLTGTPIENSVLDLWSIFDFLMPGYLPSLEDFKSLSERDPNYLKVIKKSVAPFILRRVKQDVLKDLPNKYEVIVSCEMKEEQRKTYDAFKKIAADTLNSGDNKSVFSVLPYLMRLRQTCITPSLFADNFKGESGKLNSLYNIVDEEIDNGNKILIFSQFVEALNIIESHLKNEGIQYFKITGQTPSKERLEICSTFNVNNKYKVCIISLKAGGTGLNLTGANVVIHLDPWWNYAVEEQASDRAHRIGQVRNVKVIKLICENSIEQRVIELQNMKKEIVKQVVSSDDSSITNLTKDDIEFILESN